jgi:hypothetical protein
MVVAVAVLSAAGAARLAREGCGPAHGRRGDACMHAPACMHAGACAGAWVAAGCSSARRAVARMRCRVGRRASPPARGRGGPCRAPAARRTPWRAGADRDAAPSRQADCAAPSAPARARAGGRAEGRKGGRVLEYSWRAGGGAGRPSAHPAERDARAGEADGLHRRGRQRRLQVVLCAPAQGNATCRSDRCGAARHAAHVCGGQGRWEQGRAGGREGGRAGGGWGRGKEGTLSLRGSPRRSRRRTRR